MASASQIYNAREVPIAFQKLKHSVSRLSLAEFNEESFVTSNDIQRILNAWPEILELLTDLEQCGPTVPHFDRIRQLVVQLERH